MTTNLCDHIRQRALAHGKGTPEYEVWIHHSHKCGECRDLLKIQQILEAEGEAAIAHLPQESIRKLLEHSQNLYGNGKRAWRRYAQKALVWTTRIAACVVFSLAMFKLSTPQPTAPTLITASRSSTVKSVPASSVNILDAKAFVPHPEIQISPLELTDWELENEIVEHIQSLTESHDMLNRSLASDRSGEAFFY